MSMEPIGYIESGFKDKFGTPRQPGLVKKALAKLKIRADLQPAEALQGLEGFSHVWLIWVFHQNKVARYHAKVHPPRLGGKSMGLFATRTPHRPNPIGLSLVELVSVEKDGIVVSGADLVDGTPILDIKPYLPEVESVPDARTGWPAEVVKDPIHVEFTEKAQNLLLEWQGRNPDKSLREIIEETLKLDPRPVVYRGYEEKDSPYRSEHAVRLFDGDIHFKFESPTLVRVLDILFMHN
ncbi:tRNA (N6-threonylcarbamoyladenosine(37)-N6)-methyltransferase TrmO [Bdellovibrio svalbardensis]|uniref:tRNA (N6-threonylcarbamoyladenosine(37)-N6)-methyltransferase TrmO n=1 Tax=Bdellovibrio svalbardensis TaxID=2972972 RepID=A0ABT6DKL6_9BACT|nr:tRNA (N6-threonylcarbamoyladenosine(37)-N6)-methyltransferase TrmO [Bdellovibrio svalbardensis]MDG0817089.1 tRNA (N6-threonylcarbamoyladenosine(37)-N6)-methyltransferase TrmO [Bdellovibrio svalbardensis]